MCFLNPSYLHLNTLLDRPGPGRPRVRVQLAQEQPDDSELAAMEEKMVQIESEKDNLILEVVNKSFLKRI